MTHASIIDDQSDTAQSLGGSLDMGGVGNIELHRLDARIGDLRRVAR